MSAFYVMQAQDVPAGMDPNNESAVVIWTDGASFWIHTAQNPHPLEGVLPAVKVGSSWQEAWDLAPAEVRSIFLATVRRAGERVRCLVGEVQEGDELLAVASPHRFSGERAERIDP